MTTKKAYRDDASDDDTKDHYHVDDGINDADIEIEPGKISPCATCLGLACFPCTLMCSCFCVRENTEAVILHFGKYTGVERDAGLHFPTAGDVKFVPSQSRNNPSTYLSPKLSIKLVIH